MPLINTMGISRNKINSSAKCTLTEYIHSIVCVCLTHGIPRKEKEKHFMKLTLIYI